VQRHGLILKKINGWEVNPISRGRQGFDETNYNFDSTLTPALPYLALPGQSIVKAVSDTDSARLDSRYRPDGRMRGIVRLKGAAVLTVVGAVPPDSGHTVFRPPYTGTDKPYYSIGALHTELLPSLAQVPNAPSLTTVAAGVQRLQLDHMGGVTGALLRPRDNMASSYWPYNSIRDDNTALRLMLNDPLPDKMPALIGFVQYGIDVHHSLINGQVWPSGYGIEPCHKLPLAFAAVLLGDQVMQDSIKRLGPKRIVSDDAALWPGPNGPVYIGPTSPASSYWSTILNPPPYGGFTHGGDPYGYLDGNMCRLYTNDPYQGIYSPCWKGAALAGYLLPEIEPVWNNPIFFQYADRWANHGLQAQPDPCAPIEGVWQGGAQNGLRCTSAEDVPGDAGVCMRDTTKLGVTYGPDPAHPGDCIRDTDTSDGIGRFPLYDGMLKDGGGGVYRSTFVDSVWNRYRVLVPTFLPVIEPAGGTFYGKVDVTMHCGTYGAMVRYTTNGTDPTVSSPAYTASLRLLASTVIRARSYHAQYAPSAIVEAGFIINPDVQAPLVSRIVTAEDSTKITVVFNEQIDTVTAQTAANYSLNKGVNVGAAVLGGNGTTVVLTVSAMSEDTTYTLSVRNVKDLFNNTIAANTQTEFTFANFNPVNGLMAFWHFNVTGSAGTDYSGFGYNGTVTGTVQVPGKVGAGLQFATADQVDFGITDFNCDTSNAVTVAFWMYVAGHDSTVDEVFGRTNAISPSPFSIQITGDGHVRTVFNTPSTPNTRTSTALIADSTWCHVAITYRDSARVLYLNGVKDEGGSNNLAVNLYYPNTRSTKLGNGFIGILDEVRVYNRALSAGKIAKLYADTTVSLPTAVRVPAPHPARRGPVYTLDMVRKNPALYRLYDLRGRAISPYAAHQSGLYLLQIARQQQVQKILLLGK
jgi:hypothetical protein